MTKEQNRRYSELANKWPRFTDNESSEFHSLLKENIGLINKASTNSIILSIISIIIAAIAFWLTGSK